MSRHVRQAQRNLFEKMGFMRVRAGLCVRPGFIAAFLALGGGALAQSPAIAERQAQFKAMHGASAPATRMLRGEEAFNLGAVQAALRVIEAKAKMLRELFPEDSKGGDSKTRPAAWENRSEFVARFAKLSAAAGEALKTINDEASFEREMPQVLGQCSACHREYRAR